MTQTMNTQTLMSQRGKQIATLNSDTINYPTKQSIYPHIEQLLFGVFHAVGFYMLYLSFTVQENATTNFIISLVLIAIGSLGSYFMSNIKHHLDNIRNISTAKDNYEQMRQSTVSLVFHIQCYHHQSRGTGKNRKSEKIVTHTAEKIIQFSECHDLSGWLNPEMKSSIKKPYVFIDYTADYEFLEQSQKEILQQMYFEFVQVNKRDTSQSHSKVFKFTNTEAKVQQGYLLEGENTQLKKLLAISSLFLLIWPVSLILELSSIERYKVTILKKVKLNENQAGYKKRDFVNQEKISQIVQQQKKLL